MGQAGTGRVFGKWIPAMLKGDVAGSVAELMSENSQRLSDRQGKVKATGRLIKTTAGNSRLEGEAPSHVPDAVAAREYVLPPPRQVHGCSPAAWSLTGRLILPKEELGGQWQGS